MSQHTPLDTARHEPTERPSEPPEPTHSERRLRTPVTPTSESAGQRPSRPSVRPSAFGAPRASGRPSAAPAVTPSSRPAVAAAPGSASDDEFDADTSPGLVVSALGSPIHEHWRGDPESFPPSADSLSPSVRRPSRPPAAAALTRPLTPAGGTQLELVLGRTSLPEAPSVFLVPAPTTPARTEQPRRTATSILVFAVMLCAAGVPLARYTFGSRATGAEGMPRAAASAPMTRTPMIAATSAVKPAQPAAPPTIDRLAEIMAGLPSEAEAASDYLVDHAVRARDSGELQLAETLLGRASELDDRSPHPAFALAKLRFEQGNFEGAEGWIANAIRLRPRRAEYRTLYAEVLERLGREREARDERRRAKRYAE